MNPFISKLLVVIARKRLEAKHNTTTISKKQVVPLVRILQVELSHAIKEYIFIIIIPYRLPKDIYHQLYSIFYVQKKESQN